MDLTRDDFLISFLSSFSFFFAGPTGKCFRQKQSERRRSIVLLIKFHVAILIELERTKKNSDTIRLVFPLHHESLKRIKLCIFRRLSRAHERRR